MFEVIGLAASPRKQSNTEALLDEFLRAATQAGARTEKIRLVDLHMLPCTACEACHAADRCAIEDDLSTLIPRLRQAQVVALASPIHFYALSAQAQMLISRAQRMWAQKYVLKTGDRATGRGVLIAVGATRGPRLFDGVLRTARYFFDPLNKVFEHSLLISGVDHAGLMLNDAARLDQARRLGAELVALPLPSHVRLGNDYQPPGDAPAADPTPIHAQPLGHWIELARQRERHAAELFQRMSELAGEQAGQGSLTELASMEQGHLARINQGCRGIDLDQRINQPTPGDVLRWEAEPPEPPRGLSSLKQALLCALKAGAGKRGLYLWLAKLHGTGQVAELFSSLADDESRQQQLLEEMLIRRLVRY